MRSCENLTISKCRLFHSQSVGEECLLNSNRTMCQIRNCRDYDINRCQAFVPSQAEYKCIKGKEQCELIKIECTK